MKVLMIGQLPKEVGGNFTTGAAKVVYELSKQRLDGITVYSFATNTKDMIVKKACVFPDQYIGYTIDVFGILKDFMFHPIKVWKEWLHYIRIDHQNPLRYSFYRYNIRRAIVLTKPDVIHVHSIGNVSVAKFACDGKHIPLLLTCHGIFYRGDANDTKNRDLYNGNLPFCDYLTGLTDEARHELTDILKVPQEKYSIIPNGVDCSKFYYSHEARQKIRQQMDVGDNCTVFITVASLQERKGQLVFIKLLERLEIDFQYWMIGLGPDKDVIDEYITKHQLKNKVKVLGYKDSDELFKYYSAADIYAHTSWKEGQALSEIEAYATGLRIIVNKVIVGTVIGDANSCPQYYVVDFSHVMLEDIEEWLNMKNIQRHSRRNHDWKNILKLYSEVYKKISNIA